MMTESKMTFVDKIDICGCAYIMNMDYSTFVNKYSSGWDNGLDKTDINSTEAYYNRVIMNCRKWFSMRKEGCDYIEIKQKYKYSQKDNKGRIYVDGFGIQSLQNDIRKTLTQDYYYDIDIKNCHWNILLAMIKEYNQEYTDDTIPYNYISKYCLNREQVLKDENTNKKDLLILLNVDNFKHNSKFLKKLHREKMNAYEILTDNDEYMKKYGDVETDNNKNPLSSLVNKLLCINENEIIQYAIKEEHCNIVPMFDGFMLDIDYKDIYQNDLIYICPDDSLIQWAFKSNICKDEDFIQFKKSFNPNDDSYLSTDYIHQIKNSIHDNIIDGGVLDIVIDWLYKICGEDIIYYDNLYFSYKNGVYNNYNAEKGNYELNQVLTKRIVPYIKQEVNLMQIEWKQINKKENKIEWDKAKDLYNKWIELFKCVSSSSKVQIALQLYISMSKYKQMDFYDKLDSSDNLIAFDNVVYDLYSGEFRDIEKKDCISITTGYKWSEPSDELMNEFNTKFLNKVFVNEEIREHFLKSICASLDGNKRRHKFTIWSNFGRNGKSLTMTFLKKVLGKYHGNMNSSVLQNQKAEGGNATPQFKVLRKSRLVAMNEPEITKKINSNLVKELSGGDEITMRQIYSPNIETFKPKASIVMICNDVPNMDRNDPAVMNRLDIIPFESTFGVRPNKTIITEDNYELKEFITDNDIENNLDKWRCCFFKTIVKYFKEYLKSPSFTLTSEMCDEYTEDQDLVKEFINEKLTNKDGERIKLKDIPHHLNKYLKSKTNENYTSRKLGKYFRMNNYNVVKSSGETYLYDYNFNWLVEDEDEDFL